MPDQNDPAPDFTLPDDRGGEITLSALPGPVVLYFYPRDDTSGCTRQAMAFSDLLQQFEAWGATVLAVSKDPLAAHAKFRAKHGLGVTLLSDEASDVSERYGVWVEKSMYGRAFMGIERTTFLIADGRILRVWRKVKVPGHAEQVLSALAE